MVKKTIAGVLSALMCVSALLHEVPLSSREPHPATQDPQSNVQDALTEGLTGKNSFARYLSQKSAENSFESRPLKASAAESFFSVADLEFDAETGLIRAVTTQSEDCKLIVSFIEQDHPANIYKVEKSVSAGEYVHSELCVDSSGLPEYYTISAQLVSRAGLPVCETFALNQYTREMQEILAKTTANFVPERVINFDGSDATNFAVLSDETVKAESDADSNVLVSADYDSNVYVFEQIDDDIRSLKSGKFFFSMPTEKELIAIHVTDIAINGDTATVTGNESLDGMFVFIKIEEEDTAPLRIETVDDEITASTEVALSDESGEQTFEKQYLASAAGQDEALEYIKNDAKAHEGSLNFVPTINKAGDNGLITTETKLNGTITWKYNYYMNLSSFNPKDWYACTYFVVTYDFEASFKAKSKDAPLTNGTADPPFDQSNYPLDGISLTAGTTVPITTPVKGLTIQLHPKVTVLATLDCDVSFKKQITRGFYYDTRSGMTLIRHESAENGVKMKLCGEIHVLFELTVSLNYLGLIDAYVTIRLELIPKCKVDHVEKESPIGGGHPKSGDIVFSCPGATGTTQHVCDYCLSGTLEAKVSGNVGIESHVPFLKYKDGADFGPVSRVLGPFYCSAIKTYSIGSKYKLDPGMGSCPHYANRTTVLVHFIGDAPRKGTLIMGRDSYSIGGASECKKIFYTVPGSSVKFDLQVSDAMVECSISSKVYTQPQDSTYSLEMFVYVPSTDPVEPSGPHIFIPDLDHEDTFLLTTTTQTTTTQITTTTAKPAPGSDNPTEPGTRPVAGTTTTTTKPVTTEPPEELEEVEIPTGDYIIESLQLGPYIYANLYNDGLVVAWGCGNMYEKDYSPFTNVKKIKYVCLVDTPMDGVILSDKPESEMTEAEKALQNSLKDSVINSIGRNVFNGAEALQEVDFVSVKNEKYQPSRITIISDRAFYNCTALKYIWDRGVSQSRNVVNIPENLATVGSEAFSGCKSAVFGNLQFPASIRSIGANAFEKCEGMKTVDVPGDGAPELRSGIFSGCVNLKKAALHDGIAGVGTGLFSGCVQIESVVIPNCNRFAGVTDTDTTGGFFFRYLSGSYTSTESTTSDAYYDAFVKRHNATASVYFYVPKSLKEITVESGTNIPEGYFQGMKMVETINYPDSVTSLGNNAFLNCESLKSVKLDNLASIGNSAFKGCQSAAFGDLVIPECVTFIGGGAFEDCNGLKSITVFGTSNPKIDGGVFKNCKNLKKAILHEGVEILNEGIFSGCAALEDVTLPNCNRPTNKNTMTGSHFYFHFSYVLNATGWEETSDLVTYYERIRSNGSEWYRGPKNMKNVTIEGGTVVPEGYFSGISMLESITLPGSVETVEDSAFKDCTALSSAHLTGDHASWDNVEIVETGNEPLLNLIRKKRPEGYKPGDLNGDGNVDVSDAVLLSRFATEDVTVTITDLGRLNADVNGDGNADMFDVTLILEYIAKKILKFPVDIA